MVNLDPQLMVNDTSGLPVYYDGMVIDDLPGADFMQVYADRLADDGVNYAQYLLDIQFGSSVTDFIELPKGTEQDFVLTESDMDTFFGGQLDYTFVVNGVAENTLLAFDLTNVTLRAVPEPALASLLLLGIVGIGFTRRRRV
jgi:hypothetical protein